MLSMIQKPKRRTGRGLTPAESERLRSFIKDTNLSNAELGARTGLDASTFSRFLSGDTHGSNDMVHALSGAMGINLWEHLRMAPRTDTPEFLEAIRNLKGAVSKETIAKARLIIRIPDDCEEPSTEWWMQTIMKLGDLDQQFAKLPKRALRGKK